MTEPEFILVPRAVADKYRLLAERRAERQARYNAKRPYRSNGKIPLRERPFIAWDGEGPRDTGYSLLGNSLGNELCYPHLTTADCLEFLIESAAVNPFAINIGFGFNYDASCILGDLPWRALAALKEYTRCRWNGYRIEHVPRKWLRIAKGDVSIKIFDMHSFFASSLTGALEKWRIGPWGNSLARSGTDIFSQDAWPSVPSLEIVRKMGEQELVTTFKKLRNTFLWKDIRQITIYMRLELKYTVILAGEFRDALDSAGYVPRSWHGPGAVASMAYRRHDIYSCLSPVPDAVSDCTRHAFIAGRFEPFLAGRIKKIYCADIHSAYPWYCSQLPNLANGQWRHTTRYEPGLFAVYRIRYSTKPDSYRIYPLPYRDKYGGIAWPHRVTGWYWNPEAALVADDPDADISEGWVFDENDPSDRPFAWLAEYYDQRDKWKKNGNPAEYCYKLIINSGGYGLLAKRSGWDKVKNLPPKTHQLEYAGWITSSCRAAVCLVGRQLPEGACISMDTDGVMSAVPFDFLTDEDRLGGWELTEYDEGIFWQSGIYYLRKGMSCKDCGIRHDPCNGWVKAKSRGIPKGAYTAEELITAYESGEPLRLVKNTFIGYGLALHGRRDELNTWKEEPHVYAFGGNGKRYHDAGHCDRICSGDVHRLALPAFRYGPFTDPESYPHRLPWIDAKEHMEVKEYLDDLMMYDANHLANDEEWIRDHG
jgi:hypothetical protein